MSIDDALAAGDTLGDVAHEWALASPATTVFDFDYTDGREQLLRLYDKGTRRQWIGTDRLDWSLDVDPLNPVGMPDDLHPLFGTPWWEKMTDAERGEAKRHVEAWRFSQFLHGEQGALDLHGEDRPDGPRHRFEVLRGDPGHRRGPPRRGLQPATCTRRSSSSTRSTKTWRACSTT